MTGEEGNLYVLLDPATALVAGLIASLHCVGMCGPLSCSVMRGKPGTNLLASQFHYHLGRLLSYATLGGVVGGLGELVVTWLGDYPARYAPWAFALFFLALVFGLDSRLARWQAKRGLGRGVMRAAYRMDGNMRGLALGLATPLIPCGPLYLMLWVTTMSGMWLDGAIAMSAFAVGTMPALWAAQGGWNWLSGRLAPARLDRLRRILAALALGLVLYRYTLDLGVDGVTAGGLLCR